ncbi:Trm112 family protein [Basfia succiniciproducens]|uniref:UPF0434 protein SAMN02910354_00843 n=1 Tax=Basfia succiniciproducens TaxID=653940 RepID=A0A1G5BPT3_9PAST|nr:Trm112 family protein [Basfia succiniciproducens]QIM68327.1 hypothetical protein A4G13_02415 [Basfia succiniciproducens]SCX92192.1 hypothetical protein SAMN02910354_00843 [Basfia succiniciproducens]
MDSRLLEIIACPRCQGRLQLDKENERLICRFEHIAFPIVQGIPVLLIEEAVSLAEDPKDIT